MNELALLRWGSVALVSAGAGLAVFLLGRNPAAEPAKLGHRGLKRKRALERGGLFATLEPIVRGIAGWVAHLPIREWRRRIDIRLVQAGDWLGLTADEYIALGVLGAVVGTGFGLFLVDSFDWDPAMTLLGTGIGAVLPSSRVSRHIEDRFNRISRGLPVAIDLAALCMGAGLDFPGALRQIVDKSPNREDPLVEELERILQELELGRTRAQALESFAVRVPADSVRDFVNAVVQSEQKGNPLAEVLRIQAAMLRTNRTVKAEEAAARAAVVMLLPLMMIFGSIILVLMGPFLLQGMSSGFFQ